MKYLSPILCLFLLSCKTSLIGTQISKADVKEATKEVITNVLKNTKIDIQGNLEGKIEKDNNIIATIKASGELKPSYIVPQISESTKDILMKHQWDFIWVFLTFLLLIVPAVCILTEFSPYLRIVFIPLSAIPVIGYLFRFLEWFFSLPKQTLSIAMTIICAIIYSWFSPYTWEFFIVMGGFAYITANFLWQKVVNEKLAGFVKKIKL